jgi:hypothetical protein
MKKLLETASRPSNKRNESVFKGQDKPRA